MRIFILVAGLALFSQNTASAQEKWNLKSIVDYAMANNITVKQTEVQAKISALTYQQSKASFYPNASFGGNTSVNSGNNQDPVTFNRVTQTFLTAGLQLQASADIFNFYSKRNKVVGDEWEMKAANANVGKIKNDVALSAANAYLQILLNMEQEKITLVQIAQTTEQLNTTRKQVAAGSLPELNAVQLEAQLAQDSVNYITAKGNVIQAVLNLKSFMNIDAAAPFEVDTPPVEAIPVEPIADLQPENVYTIALTNQPLQQVNDYRLKAAQKYAASAKGAMYPSFSAFGALATNFLSFKKVPIYDKYIAGYLPTGLRADAGSGTYYNVESAVFANGALLGYSKPLSLPNQFENNFNQNIGISMNVPIFNGRSLRTNYEKSKQNINTLELQKQMDDQKLKQDIYGAYNAAMIALEKFNSSKKSVSSSEQTYSFAQKRFDVGMLSTFDLITAQNNLFRAKLEYTINHFDYVFKMKVLEFYKGLGLKL